MAPTILLDTASIRLGRTHETVRSPSQKKRSGPFKIDTIGYQRTQKTLGAWHSEQVRYIPGICAAIKNGRFRAFTYWLIDVEFSSKLRFRSRTVMDYDFFDGIRLEDIWDPLIVNGIPLARRGAGLFDNDYENSKIMVSLNQSPRFLEILAALGTPHRHSFDAHHIWFAETHNLDFFVTGDKALINLCQQIETRRRNPIRFHTKVVSLAEFGVLHDVVPTDLTDIDIPAW